MREMPSLQSEVTLPHHGILPTSRLGASCYQIWLASLLAFASKLTHTLGTAGGVTVVLDPGLPQLFPTARLFGDTASAWQTCSPALAETGTSVPAWQPCSLMQGKTRQAAGVWALPVRSPLYNHSSRYFQWA